MSKSSGKDEHYVIDLCDEVLGLSATRQHKFDFLLGDRGPKRPARRLPVDAYYKSLNLVIEYHERQHSEPVAHFDKQHILTVSGVHRGEQRRLYDERRRTKLPENGLQLVIFTCSEFSHHRNKRLKRESDTDRAVVRERLSSYLPKSV